MGAPTDFHHWGRPRRRGGGHDGYIVQDLVLRAHVVEFRCERWVKSDGTLLTAPLPDGVEGV